MKAIPWAWVESSPRARMLPWVFLVAPALLAYRSLLTYDPSAKLRDGVEGAEEFLFEPAGGSPLLLLLVAAWLVWRRREALRRCFGSPPRTLVSSVLVTVAVVLTVWAYYVEAADLLILALMALIPGVAGLLGGWLGIRTVLVPTLILALAFPIPSVLLNQFIFPLQLLTAQLTHVLLGILGIPSWLQGDQILVADRIFQVIEACSGLRLMETLTMAAIVYADLLGRPRGHALLLVVAAPLLGVLINAARVLSIVLVPYSEFAAVHTTQGIVMLVVGVVVLAGVDWLLERVLRRSGTEPAEAAWTQSVPPDLRMTTLRVAALGSLLGALGLVTLGIPRWVPHEVRPAPLYALPVELGEWRLVEGLPLDQTFLGSVYFSEWVHRIYRSGDQSVGVLLGADDRLERRTSLSSPKTAIAASGWVVEDRSHVRLDEEAFEVQSMWLRSRNRRMLVYHWYEGVESLPVETVRALFGLDRGPRRRPGRALVVRLSTPVATPRDRATAEQRLRDVAQEVRAALRQLEGARQLTGASPDRGRVS